MRIDEIRRLQGLMRNEDWPSVYAMLDEIRDRSGNPEDRKREIHWRVAAFERQQCFEEALELLRRNSGLFNSQSFVHHEIAAILVKLGRDGEALEELRKAPIEAEMASFYGLAIDAKFFYFYLLAKSGDASARERLAEIPDDYRHITMGGKFLTKADIEALLR